MDTMKVLNGYIFTPVFGSVQYIIQDVAPDPGTGNNIIQEGGSLILTEGGAGLLQE